MTAIGGFFELELPEPGESYHPRAFALSSGRACLRRILERLKPERVWAPFYVCDAVLPAIAHAGASVQFYAIDEALNPVLPARQSSGGDVVLYVNYFGVKSTAAAALTASRGQGTVIDDTQAFFQRGYHGASSFNSARKFFGVPDGAYAYGRQLDAVPARAPAAVRYDHLITRLSGDRQRAFQQYRDSEACVNDEPVAMSSLSKRLLASVDYANALKKRQDNFRQLHASLGGRNRLPMAHDAAEAGPFCYPLLVETPVSWEALWAREIFAPQLWPEIAARSTAGDFYWERELADKLIPLPIDQRYGPQEMARVAATVAEVMAW